VSNPFVYPKGGKGAKEAAFHAVVLQQPSFMKTLQEGVLGNPSLDMVLSRLSALVAQRKTVRRANNQTGQGQANPPSDELDDALAEQVKFEETLANEKDASAQQKREQVSKRL
jgi:hypothetical protein